MVTFFGLKFGGDKKKGVAKSSDKTVADGWKGIDQIDLAQREFYGTGQQDGHLARPGTSYSATKPPSNWRQTFKGFGANSSMVDLSAPMRKQSVSSLRYQSSEVNLKQPWMNCNTANLPLPSALGGSGPRVGAPERPSTANGRTKEWVNPLDVHFGKEHTVPPAPAISIETAGRSPLRLEFGTDVRKNGEALSKSSNSEEQNPQQRTKTETTHSNGYPSPPQSVSNADQTLSPVTSNLSMVNGASPDPASLPSPAASATRTSEEGWDVPVIRNVLAKRDTTTFHSPRRRSFTMDLEEQELDKLRKQRQTEGFAGSFADFDFGETVTKQASINQIPEPPVSSSTAQRTIEYIAAAGADEREPQPPLWPEQQSGPILNVQDRRTSSTRLDQLIFRDQSRYDLKQLTVELEPPLRLRLVHILETPPSPHLNLHQG
ncbi:hypothetical protein NQ176_g8282 [Zarea fungicola]|uniref:Uncharacterized protein n=1 Tax=Zarea fungicola TaxID=93591 RepID=A0ACC1MTD7_9HYPO|nr:hypothetical protein NQ176_g8282 [Lecanicillium fungicola]